MNRKKIANEYDYLVARAELETDKVRSIVDSARSENDYYREKTAAKLLVFCESEEKTVRLYAEIKLHYPELGELVDKRWPHYRAQALDAKEKLGGLDIDNGN